MSLSFPVIPEELLRTTRIPPGACDLALAELRQYARTFRPAFHRVEQSRLAEMILEGFLSDLHRKSVEPIAIAHEHPRQSLQRFVGAGRWEDARVRRHLRRDIASAIGDAEGILILDSSGFPKKGTHSVGVARQWCGRLGKEDNCQVGVFVGYAGQGSSTLVEGDLYLPHEWTRSRARLTRAHVPREMGFRTKTTIAKSLVATVAPELPHAWIVGDDEFGRPAHFRRWLRRREERYLLEVPGNTLIRDLEEAPPPRPRRRGRPAEPPWTHMRDWAQTRDASAWSRVLVRDGEKGRLEVEVTKTRARARQARAAAAEELLVVTRTLGPKPEYRYYLSNAHPATGADVLARVAASRFWIEYSFQVAKDDLGMDHYEVRSWVGWHHHMTLAFLAQWFAVRQHRQLGEKIAGTHAVDHCTSPADPAA